MKDTESIIKCPSCGEEIDVNHILYNQVESELKKQYDSKINIFENQKKEFEKNIQKQEEEIKNKINKGIEEKEEKLREKISNELTNEQSKAIKMMEEEIAEKSKRLIEFNTVKIEMEKLKREKDEIETTVRLEAEKELNKKIAIEKEKIVQTENEKNDLKVRELIKQLEDQKKLTEEMKRKQEQGSMQMQGEVQELAIEEWLSEKFPLDTIQEIKKGERGADCLQIVNTRSKQGCGTIYYESKRTKAFQQTWIEKFKEDIRSKGADIGVLVTEIMPNDMSRFGLKDGIWVCSFEEFKGLSSVLRESVINISNAIISQENKGDKMGMLYDFLTSLEFKSQVEAIVEGFSQMKNDLESEKRAMNSIWKKREKQIEKVILNTTNMYGSIKGIAGNAVKEIEPLELKQIG